MTQFVALPLIGTLAAAYLATSAHRRLRPDIAAKTNVIALTTLLLAAIPTMWLIGLSGLAHIGVRSPFTDWSQHLLPTLGPTGAAIGMSALVLMVVGTFRSFLVYCITYWRLRSAAVEVLPTDAVFAYTLPGPGGNIVLSEGLVESLSERECRAVVAHERAHGRHRHDRYLVLGRLATALLPPAKPLVDRLEFSLERWADHDAALAVGDRRLVATAIARVAVSGTHPVPSAPWRSLVEGAVGSVFVVVPDVVDDDSFELALVPDDGPIEELAADPSEQAFSVA